jgi:hypothetical protein
MNTNDFTLTNDDFVGSKREFVSITSSSCGDMSPIIFNTGHLFSNKRNDNNDTI